MKIFQSEKTALWVFVVAIIVIAAVWSLMSVNEGNAEGDVNEWVAELQEQLYIEKDANSKMAYHIEMLETELEKVKEELEKK